MKTLAQNVIVYDAACPLCSAYTAAFVRSGMLDTNGRVPFQELTPELATAIDLNRSVDEIALYDQRSGTVRYGVDSLLEVITHERPFLRHLLTRPMVLWSARKLYKLVSYNRRVIVPASKSEPAGFSCAPHFSMRYRMIYLMLALLVSALILSHYSSLLTGPFALGGYQREILVCGGQILWQLTYLSRSGGSRQMEYLGNMLTVSLAGSLLLMIPLITGLFASVPPLVAQGYFIMVVVLMFLEHLRRCRLLHLGIGVSISWVLYRVLVLLLLIF